MGRCVQDAGRWAISGRCQSKKDCAVHELEVEGVQETQEGEIETVSIDLVHLNRKWSLITAHLEVQAGKHIIEIPYKIDTGSEGNIMLLYIFKKLFKNTTEDQLKNFIKSHIRLSKIQQNKYNAIRDMCSNN